jgi:hypothetical protein
MNIMTTTLKKTMFAMMTLVFIVKKDTLALSVKCAQKQATTSVSQTGDVPNAPHQLCLLFNSWVFAVVLP